MSERKTLVKVYLGPNAHSALLAQKARTGRSLSSLVEEAIENYLFHLELASEVRRAGEAMREVRAALSDLRAVMEDLERTLSELKSWARVSAFWGALLTELFKSRLFQTRKLDDKELEVFRSLWRRAHEAADLRLEALTGERVWKGGFDPEVPPGKKN